MFSCHNILWKQSTSPDLLLNNSSGRMWLILEPDIPCALCSTHPKASERCSNCLFCVRDSHCCQEWGRERIWAPEAVGTSCCRCSSLRGILVVLTVESNSNNEDLCLACLDQPLFPWHPRNHHCYSTTQLSCWHWGFQPKVATENFVLIFSLSCMHWDKFLF